MNDASILTTRTVYHVLDNQARAPACLFKNLCSSKRRIKEIVRRGEKKRTLAGVRFSLLNMAQRAACAASTSSFLSGCAFIIAPIISDTLGLVWGAVVGEKGKGLVFGVCEKTTISSHINRHGSKQQSNQAMLKRHDKKNRVAKQMRQNKGITPQKRAAQRKPWGRRTRRDTALHGTARQTQRIAENNPRSRHNPFRAFGKCCVHII